ncbi:MAG: hypothetical protein C0440_04105 [Candidatus Pelagibacter sp.]|nr:hypothetical protein [Candidatus Pelagibacter sp.]
MCLATATFVYSSSFSSCLRSFVPPLVSCGKIYTESFLAFQKHTFLNDFKNSYMSEEDVEKKVQKSAVK